MAVVTLGDLGQPADRRGTAGLQRRQQRPFGGHRGTAAAVVQPGQHRLGGGVLGPAFDRQRTLRRITIDDADQAAQVFELLMGSDVAPRKEFIVQGAYDVDVEALDA